VARANFSVLLLDVRRDQANYLATDLCQCSFILLLRHAACPHGPVCGGPQSGGRLFGLVQAVVFEPFLYGALLRVLLCPSFAITPRGSWALTRSRYFRGQRMETSGASFELVIAAFMFRLCSFYNGALAVDARIGLNCPFADHRAVWGLIFCSGELLCWAGLPRFQRL